MHPNDRIQKPFTITLCIYASGSASELKMFMLFLGLSSNLSRYTSYWNNLGVQIVHAGCPTGTTSEFKSFTLAVPLRQTHEFKSFRPVRAEPLSSGLARCHSLEQPQKSNLSRRTGGRGVGGASETPFEFKPPHAGGPIGTTCEYKLFKLLVLLGQTQSSRFAS